MRVIPQNPPKAMIAFATGLLCLLQLVVHRPAAAEGFFEKPFFGQGNITDGKWGLMLFGGQLSEGELADILIPTDAVPFTNTSFIGIALSKEIYRFDGVLEGLSIEVEGGLGYQFGGLAANRAGQVWGALYGRYDNFPWNHIVHTSVATSVGLNYITKKTAFEISETDDGNPAKLLHYFSPEIAFSDPARRDVEYVFRLHHRSSASGVFGCDGCGSNIVTFGIRKRF